MKPLKFSVVSKAFKRGAVQLQVISDLSFELEPGTVLGLIGPNGAGKTTAIRIGCGLIVPDSGSVEVAGRNPARDPEARGYIGTLLESSRNLYWRLNALENLEYFGGLKGMPVGEARKRARFLLSQLGLEDKATVPIQALSRGMQQRVAIIAAMIARPQILFLDEPTVGLDHASSQVIEQHVPALATNEGTAICVTSHQPEVIRAMASRVIVLRNGAIAREGRLRDIESIRAGYDIELRNGLDVEARAELATMFPHVELTERSLTVACDPLDLYDLLEYLRPREIVRIVRRAGSLDDWFGTLH
jgi:ABC-2 type transport system ATP-binding protein